MIDFNKNIELNQNAKILYFDSIRLKPLTWYCQQVNLPIDSGWTFTVADCQGTEIGSYIFYENGYLEFVVLDNHYLPCRFVATRPNTATQYSNYFEVDNGLSLRFDYKNTDELWQSISLNGYFTDINNESNAVTYIQESGAKVSSRAILTTLNTYVFNNLDNNTYLELNKILASEFVYVNGKRITDKPIADREEVEGDSNIFGASFEGAVSDETFIYQLQIAQPLQIIDYSPKGVYSNANFINEFKITFNTDLFTIGNGSIVLIEQNESETQQNLNIVSILANEVILNDMSNVQNGNYQILVPTDKFQSIFGNLPFTVLPFKIQNADFSNIDFNSNDFLI